jgi:mRNA interferase HigB
MEISGQRLTAKFKRMHSDARNPLDDWIDKVTPAIWKTPADIKRMFSTASFVRHFVIFNIGGNKYRLLTSIDYGKGIVRIIKVGTHEEYDKWKL